MIHALVMSAKKQNALIFKPSKRFYERHIKPFTFRRHINAQRLVIGIDCVYRVENRLRQHNHARAAPERIIVALFVLVRREFANIGYAYVDKPLFASSPDYAFAKGREHFGEKRQNVNPHIRSPRRKRIYTGRLRRSPHLPLR